MTIVAKHESCEMREENIAAFQNDPEAQIGLLTDALEAEDHD